MYVFKRPGKEMLFRLEAACYIDCGYIRIWMVWADRLQDVSDKMHTKFDTHMFVETSNQKSEAL